MLGWPYEFALRYQTSPGVRGGVWCRWTAARLRIPLPGWFGFFRQRFSDHTRNRAVHFQPWLTDRNITEQHGRPSDCRSGSRLEGLRWYKNDLSGENAPP